MTVRGRGFAGHQNLNPAVDVADRRRQGIALIGIFEGEYPALHLIHRHVVDNAVDKRLDILPSPVFRGFGRRGGFEPAGRTLPQRLEIEHLQGLEDGFHFVKIISQNEIRQCEMVAPADGLLL